MKLSDLAIVSDQFTDEQLMDEQMLSYANEALAIINTEVGLKLPAIEKITDDYVALPDSWFKRLVSKYMSYGIKMNDGSLNEAVMYKEDFNSALGSFADRAYPPLIAEEFIDDDFRDTGVVAMPVYPDGLIGTGLGYGTPDSKKKGW